MREPSVDQLPAALRQTAKAIAQELRDAGHQAWLVGGSVRDLVLERPAREIDMATDAPPEKIESLFSHTTAVGKAFGTIVVHRESSEGSIDVELTTFRADGDYSDGRRPDVVTYGSSVEEDAKRRDFTCNALYLDPLGDDFQDPERGMADLRTRVLRAVGNPLQRFREDGLRILRLARFAALLSFDPAPETLRAASECAEMLRAVSPERILAELCGIFEAEEPVVALRLLNECHALPVALPELLSLTPPGREGEAFLELRLRALEALGRPQEPPTALAVLLDPDPLGEAGGERTEQLVGLAEGQLSRLHPSRAQREAVWGTWHLQQVLRRFLGPEAQRSARILMFRHPAWSSARASLSAWLQAVGRPGTEAIARLEQERSTMTAAELHPEPLLTSADLDEAGVERGPRWGELLKKAETLQLDEDLKSREEALRWLREQG